MRIPFLREILSGSSSAIDYNISNSLVVDVDFQVLVVDVETQLEAEIQIPKECYNVK